MLSCAAIVDKQEIIRMTDNITIKLLTPSDIHPEMLKSFNDRQVITDIWVKTEDRYTLSKTNEVYMWNDSKRIWISQYLARQMESGGYVAGAFFGNKLVGFASIDGVLEGVQEKYANLTMLFVDDDFKRKGIGRSLFSEMCRCAKGIGADKLFISAIPSYETVAFYFNMGCLDAKQIIEDFVDTEEDRYMEYYLKGSDHQP